MQKLVDVLLRLVHDVQNLHKVPCAATQRRVSSQLQWARAPAARVARGAAAAARGRCAPNSWPAGGWLRTRTRALPASASAPPTEPARVRKARSRRGAPLELRPFRAAHAPGFQTSRRYHSSAASELCNGGAAQRRQQRQRVSVRSQPRRTGVSSTGSKMTRASDAMARDAGRAVSL